VLASKCLGLVERLQIWRKINMHSSHTFLGLQFGAVSILLRKDLRLPVSHVFCSPVMEILSCRILCMIGSIYGVFSAVGFGENQVLLLCMERIGAATLRRACVGCQLKRKFFLSKFLPHHVCSSHLLLLGLHVCLCYTFHNIFRTQKNDSTSEDSSRPINK
jgi:hypothetical protein